MGHRCCKQRKPADTRVTSTAPDNPAVTDDRQKEHKTVNGRPPVAAKPLRHHVNSAAAAASASSSLASPAVNVQRLIDSGRT